MKFIERFMAFMGIFLLYVVYSSIAILLLASLGINIDNMSLISKSFSLIGIDLSFMFILYFIFRKDLNYEFKKFLNRFNTYISFGFKFWVIGLVIMVISNNIIGIFVPEIANNEAAIQQTLKEVPLYIIFASCIFAPFTEEIIFRKCLGKLFKNDLLFIIASGFLFGLIHNLSSLGTSQMLYIIPYGTFGVIFAYMYRKTKTIFVPMAFHFMHNTIFIIISLYLQGVI